MNNKFGRNFRSLLIIFLLTTVTAAVLGGYALGSVWFQSASIPVNVEDPVEILQYPTGLSLFPGETKQFTITVQNQASINYTVALDFKLNDTAYQTKYVTFSNLTYEIIPGEQTLEAWLSVSSNAPPASLLLTVSRKEDTQQSPTPTPEPSATPSPTATPAPSQNSTLPPSVTLLGGGARWAAPNGTSALYISWKDCWIAHGKTDGVDWGPWDPESTYDTWRAEITQALQQDGFTITYAGDMPQNLTGYNLVVIEAFWAIEPRHQSLVRNFVANGGGVVMLGGTPCFFSVYCKDRWPYRAGEWPTGPGGTDLTSLQDWFGFRYYLNVGGGAHSCGDNPFGTSLLASDRLFYTAGGSAASVTTPGNSTQVIAQYDGGTAFAFTHEFGAGRVYWQGHIWPF